MSLPIEQRIAHYRAWAARQPLSRPMIGLLWEPDIRPLPAFMERVRPGRPISPDQVDPELFLPYIEDCYRQDSALDSDVIQPFTPAFGIPWVEAIAGCPVVPYPGSLWAEPCVETYENRPPIVFDPENPWLRKLIEFTKAMVNCSSGRFAVALPQMRGPLDTLAAMRGAQRMCLDLLEQPEETVRLLNELTDLWISIAGAVLQAIPPYHGGYCTRMKMWAPGLAVNPQNDTSTLISPAFYKRFVLPCDQQITDHFPYHSFHMHSSEHHQIDNLLALEKLTAIQLTLEQNIGGPPLSVSLPAARRILEKKPLLLVALDVPTADICLRELPAAGLCLMIGFNAPRIPEEYVRWLDTRLAG